MNIDILKTKDKTDKTRAAAAAKLDAARKRRSKERKEKGEPALYSDEMNASTEILRNSRMALAEKVLSELSRSEEYRLSQGGDTTDDIKAERAKRRSTDPKAQRYAGRGVKKVKGKDSQGHGVYRRLAGTKVAKDARANRVGAKVVTANASTEIIKKGRMALAEKVLSELSRETLQSYKDKITPDVARMRGDRGLNKANTKLTKIAQGKNTPSSVFGKKGTKTSTTAGGGTLGSELAKVKPETQQSMNRRGTSTVDKKKVAANLADARSGRNTASLAKEIAADNAKRAAAKRAEG